MANRHEFQGITDEDRDAFFAAGLQPYGVVQPCYDYGIADRNDYAVMLARTVLSSVGCRATQKRVMPA